MDEPAAPLPPTSVATTIETEPEVVAGILSAEGGPDLPTEIRADAGGFGGAGALALLIGGMALGFAAALYLRSR